MMKIRLSLMALLMTSLVVFTSCKKKDDPKPENEEEVIKEATLTFTATDDSKAVVTMTAKKKENSNDYEILGGKLNAGVTYDLAIALDDEINKEILEEADVHQFYFTFTDWVTAFEYADKDTKGKPLGMKSKITISETAKDKQTLQVTLKHEPNKDKNNATKPYIYNAEIGGSSDLDLSFDVEVAPK